MKIAYNIIAVREREDLVNDLVKRLGTENVKIFYDEEHKGCMWNAMRAWRSYVELGDDITHVCLIADDALLVKQFREATLKSVKAFPDAIWTFASHDVTINDAHKTSAFTKIWNHTIRGLCYLMPKSMVPDFISFYEENFMQYSKQRWTHDNTTCNMFALMNDIDVMITIPNLAVNKGMFDDSVAPVIKGHKNVKRDVSCWLGEDIKDFMIRFESREYSVSKKRNLFALHLDDNEPICVKVKKKYKLIKAMEG